MNGFEIVGAEGRVEDVGLVLRILEESEGDALLLNARMVMGVEHLESAADHAMRAFRRQENSARKVSTETLLYCAGERQISKALRTMGLKHGDEKIALVLFGMDGEGLLERLKWRRNDTVLDVDEKKDAYMRGRYPGQEGICTQDLALEQVAFLDINR